MYGLASTINWVACPRRSMRGSSSATAAVETSTAATLQLSHMGIATRVRFLNIPCSLISLFNTNQWQTEDGSRGAPASPDASLKSSTELHRPLGDGSPEMCSSP